MTTARRAEELGTKVMVVGSGRQRAYPAEAPWPPIQSAIDLLDMMQSSESPLEGFAKMIEYFQTGPTGITFAPESLNRSETNVGNDCGELARVLQDHGVSYTADSYHLLYEWDSDYREGSLDYPSKGFWNDQIPFLPAHVHLGDLPRVLPNPSDPMIRGFMDRLNELGYDGRISLECTIPEKDYVRAADVLREIIRG